MTSGNLKISLFVIRITLAIFFGQWAIEKFAAPEVTVAIWRAFYLVENFPLEASYAIGVLQGVAVLCLLFGIAKFWSYGFFLVIHGIGTVLTYERLLDPFTSGNHLFVAAVPVFGALLALFLLRKEDTILTFSRG